MDKASPELKQLISHYAKWRRVYGSMGKPAPDEPDWENGRLNFRYGYPHPDWWAYVLEVSPGPLHRVLRASTERRETPVESLRATFSRIEDAGKYIIYEIAEDLRIACGLDPITWNWRAKGLDPRVDKVDLAAGESKYVLHDDPSIYFTAYSGGIQPYNHILAISYDELDAELLEGFPEEISKDVAP